MRTSATKIFAATLMLGFASLSFAQAKPAAPNPVLTTPPNAGTGPSSSIGPSSAQGGPAMPGTSLGTTGVPNNVNTAARNRGRNALQSTERAGEGSLPAR